MSDEKSIEIYSDDENPKAEAVSDRVAEIRALLRRDRRAAIASLRALPTVEKQRLFLELVGLAAVEHDDLETVRREIRDLPRDWVVANIETAAEFQLMLPRGDGADEFRLLHELYLTIDNDLANRLAQRGREHSSNDVRKLFSTE